LDYIEINPALIEIGEMFTDNLIMDEKIRIINRDARLFLSKTKKRYDVVLINLPNPSNVQLNRYYTLEFFEKLKDNLNARAGLWQEFFVVKVLLFFATKALNPTKFLA